MSSRLLLNYLLMLLSFQPSLAFWWYFGEKNAPADCHDLIKLKLTREQKKECSEGRKFIKALSSGLNKGIVECEKEFAKKRWNCHTNKEYPNLFGNIVNKDLKETGFIYALMSASSVVGIVDACSDGDIYMCGCMEMEDVPDPLAGWSWGGCSDSVENIVVEKTKIFIDSPHKDRTDLSSRIKKHNNRAGYLAVREHMETVCKCQGLSGSCTVKTCYQRIPPIDSIGANLMKEYTYSIRVLESITDTSGINWILYDPHGTKPIQSNLVYSESTDMDQYCSPNEAVGSVGTAGRLCSVTSAESDACNNLCCGRDYIDRTKVVDYDCNCKFVYENLEMKCDRCHKTVIETTCT